MAFGLQIWNVNGEKTLEVTDSLTKYVGTFALGENPGTTGSGTYADLAGGRPFAMCWRTSTSPTMYFVPNITFSGTTATWTYPGSGNSSRAAVRVVMGVY